MSSTDININKLIPHRPPMVMIDRFVKKNATAGTGEKQFSAGDYGCKNGFVLQAVLIECVAQTVAAHHGYDRLEEATYQPALGMLVAIDRFDFFHPVPDDALVTVNVDKTYEIGLFHLIQGEIFLNEKLMAQGRIKIFNKAGGQEKMP